MGGRWGGEIMTNLCHVAEFKECAEVAKLVDALGLGPSGGNLVRVRVSPSAPIVGNLTLWDRGHKFE